MAPHPGNALARLAGLLLVGAIVAGCGSSTAPDPAAPSSGVVVFEASFNPDGPGVVLQRLEEVIPGQAPIRVELIGRSVVLGPGPDEVSIEVCVRNTSERTLHAPAFIWLGRFAPSTVEVVNADSVLPHSSISLPRFPWGFDYSHLLGDDAALSPREESGAKTWRFHVPGQTAFEFGGAAQFALLPGRAHVAGLVFLDANANAVLDSSETGVREGILRLTAPDGTVAEARPDRSGRFAFRVAQVGLYHLALHGPFSSSSVRVTTTNPLEILLPPGHDGGPQSYDGAVFGITHGTAPPEAPVIITDLQPHEITPQDRYRLVSARLREDILILEVGFSGCSPDHPFALYVSRAFQESFPVQTWALLSHDDQGELCDAAWMRTLEFDLAPLRRAYVAAYGGPGLIRLHFQDYQGTDHEFLFGP